MENRVETVTNFLFLGSKITSDGDCNHEIRRWLLLGRKAKTNLNSILERKDITLPTRVHVVKAMAFLIVLYRCGRWSIKKAEHQRIDVFELWCWKRPLESSLESNVIKPVNIKRNQPWILIGRTAAEAEAPIIWPPDTNSWLMEKTPMLGKIEGRRKREWQRMRWLNGITD